MTRRKLMVEHCPPEAGRNPCTLELPSHWTPAQATAVFEYLDDLNALIWRSYGGQIQQVLRRDRSVTTSPIPANIDDGDVPF